MDLNPAQTLAAEAQPRRSALADVLVLVLILVGIFSLIEMGRQWHQPFQREVSINLSPWYLPYYTLLSFSRGAIAYVLSLLFTLCYARWAAYDRGAERFLIPLLDILQSLPLPAFLVPIEIALVSAFPHSEIGIELTCIIVIFTGQVWNMTFSFYYSLKALPDDFKFVGRLAKFTPWQRFTQIELPFASKGLVYNSMVSMAGGWFFLSIIEAFDLNHQDYRVRGLGSYMSVAQQQKDYAAQVYDVLAMLFLIIALDQLVWRPLIVWSNKFKMEDTEAEFQDRSAVLNYLGRSRLGNWLHTRGTRLLLRRADVVPVVVASAPARVKRASWIGLVPWRKIFLGVAVAVGAIGAVHVVALLGEVKAGEWLVIGYSLVLTLIRVLAAVAIRHAEEDFAPRHDHRGADRGVDRRQSASGALSHAVDADRRVVPVAARLPEPRHVDLFPAWQPRMGCGRADDFRSDLVYPVQRDLGCQRHSTGPALLLAVDAPHALADVAHALAAGHFSRADHGLDHRCGRGVERQHRLRVRPVRRQDTHRAWPRRAHQRCDGPRQIFRAGGCHSRDGTLRRRLQPTRLEAAFRTGTGPLPAHHLTLLYG
jgi:ABC-type nitrate/sulfonate/bicarbonate transport system permease component